MIEYLKSDRHEIPWLIFHLLLGIASAITPYLFIAWFYIVAISTTLFIFSYPRRRGENIHFFLAYIIGFELLGRMARTSPILPYEAGKYFMCLFFLLGILFSIGKRKQSSLVGWSIFLLSIPSLFVIGIAAPVENIRSVIIFNYLGLLNLGLAVIYFSRQALSVSEVNQIMRLMVYSIISVMGFLIIRTPKFQDIDFGLYSSEETSGGFGPNQVSTILGLGFALVGFAYLTGQRLFKSKIISLGIFVSLVFWALLSFSRGGVVGGLLGLVAVILMPKSNKNQFVRFKKVKFSSLLIALLAMGSTFFFVNTLTNNYLLLRYSGETGRTMAGRDDKNFNTVTSGRAEIILSDLYIWADYPLLGVGPGTAQKLRASYGVHNPMSHTEISRLLSEHGIPGMIIASIFLFYPLYLYNIKKDNYSRAFILFFCAIAIFSSMHAALRTMITPLLYGLSVAYIIPSVIYSRSQVMEDMSTSPAKVDAPIQN